MAVTTCAAVRCADEEADECHAEVLKATPRGFRNDGSPVGSSTTASTGPEMLDAFMMDKCDDFEQSWESECSVPEEMTVYPDTDSEGDPEVKSAEELWPRATTGPSSPMQRQTPSKSSPAPSVPAAEHLLGHCVAPELGQMEAIAPLRISPQPAGRAAAPVQVRAPAGHNNRSEVTTLIVQNLPKGATQQEFLDEVNRSGFAGAYDFAYVPRRRDIGLSAGHAFINFKAPELALAFRAAWHGSARLGAGPGADTLNVAPSSVQGFRANSAKWSSNRAARVKNSTFLPFICQAGPRAAPESNQSTRSGDTTLMVRNLPGFLTQQEFLNEVNRSGFVGTYDFAYLPCSRDNGSGCGHAFINFKTPVSATSFAAAWHKSARFNAGYTGAVISVVAAAEQGLQANAARWNPARMAKVKNPKFFPFFSSAALAPALTTPR